MAANPRLDGGAQSAPAWLADAATGKPDKPGERMIAAIAAVHLGDMTRRAVLLCLAYRDGRGGSRPSVDEIAERLGKSAATVHRHLNALREAGAVWWRQSRGASRYVLNWPLILSHRCESLEAGNSRTGARDNEPETLANVAGNS
ncbi:MAG: helix-turn-helix domain-containing protein, partial [Alphaproteobacteria bacterium]|nr:helix-turn-helix domain-containing protein [Alphaproteobacteria bacterium]